MKTIVKAIESMLAQDATQQWTAARAGRSGLHLELGLTPPSAPAPTASKDF